MPKVNLLPERAAAQELNRCIVARISYYGYTMDQLADKLHMPVRTLYRRLESPGKWDLIELWNLNKILNLEDSISRCFEIKNRQSF